MIETIVLGTRSHPTPPGPQLVLDFDKIVLLLVDHSSKTIGNLRASDRMRDTGHENNFLLVSKEDTHGAWTTNTEPVNTVSRDGGGRWGIREKMDETLVALDVPHNLCPVNPLLCQADLLR